MPRLSLPSFKSTLAWLDDNLLLVIAGFLLAFIPLYPKIPIWSPIEQYIVRVRLEDFLVLGATIVWLIQTLRGKVRWRTPVFGLMVAYAVVGLLSLLSAFFVIQTIPLQPLHAGKSILHYFRYLEYFSLFVIVFSAIKRRQHVWNLLIVFAITVLAITGYGYGQKYYYFPVYSTMNREFSKGVRLYLTPHARVQSTFAGHYDMAAYLVVALPILLAMAYMAKEKKWKILFYTSFWLGSWLLILGASRTSFAAFPITLAIVVGLLAWQKPTWKEKIKFGLTRSLILLVGLSFIFAVFGSDLNERLAQVIDKNQYWHDTFHSLNKQRKDLFATLTGQEQTSPPPGSLSTDEAIAQGVLTPTDERPVSTRPSDVYVDVPDIQKVATISADGSTQYIDVDKGPRVYSECALKRGLSLCIRLDTLWPRALDAFKRSPLLGTGYATLNKETLYQFTEAESTDNNFLRTLGETGALGFVTFYGVIAFCLWQAWKHLNSSDAMAQTLSIGFIAASVGLLLNAVFIDVFAASKVAFSYWALVGIFVGYLNAIAKGKNS